MRKKIKYQQLGSKTKYSLNLGSKQTNEYLDKIERKKDVFYIEKLREVYENMETVKSIEFTEEEKTLLRLLRGEVNGMILKETTVIGSDIVYVFRDTGAAEDATRVYIIVINRYTGLHKHKSKVTADIEEIYKTVENHLKGEIENLQKLLPLKKSKDAVIGSFGYSSKLAEEIAETYNIHHVAFNPILFKSKARVYKIRGDPLSLYAIGEDTYEIVQSFTGLDNNASNIKNFHI